MKKSFILLLAAVLLTACGGNQYKVKGTVDGAPDGTMVYMNAIIADQLFPIDSTAITGGKFSFSGVTDTCDISILSFDVDGQFYTCSFFTEPGKINVDFNLETCDQFTGGTPTNDAFQKFYDKVQLINADADELEDKIRMTAAAGENYQKFADEMTVLQDRYCNVVQESILENADNVFGLHQLLDSYDLFEPTEVKEFLDALAPAFATNDYFIQLLDLTASQLRTVEGMPYIDFDLPLLDRKFETPATLRLSECIAANKLVLVDFWASWCTPCRNEIPNLKAAYDKFKSKGFTIVSVSVDEEREDWIEAVKEEGMAWPQVYDNVMDLTGSAASRYAVTAIPSTFLIDADGTIIGRNLRGEEVIEALEDYFK